VQILLMYNQNLSSRYDFYESKPYYLIFKSFIE